MTERNKNIFGWVGIVMIAIFAIRSCSVIDAAQTLHDNGLSGVVNSVWYGSKGKR